MPRADYAHWNEDADHMWWQEEGRHETYEEPYDDGEAPDGDWEDFDDDDAEVDPIAPEEWYREDLGWSGGFE